MYGKDLYKHSSENVPELFLMVHQVLQVQQMVKIDNFPFDNNYLADRL